MHCPELKELAKPLPDKTGWPWTEETSKAPAAMADGSAWPKISIVTPSFNQGPFIEETIRSVLLQGYPDLEYIIVDGGSTDNSLEIIKRYEPWLSFWVSEPDGGQSHAINKGFEKATGEFLGWLNSDDYFLPGGLRIIAELIKNAPSAVAWVGGCYDIDKGGKQLRFHSPRIGDKSTFADWWHDGYFCQPGCIIDRKALDRVGGLNEKLHFVLDVELWMRLATIGRFASTDKAVATSRLYDEAKTFQDLPMREVEHMAINFLLDEKDIARKRLVRFAENYAKSHALQYTAEYFKPKNLTRILSLVVNSIWRRIKK